MTFNVDTKCDFDVTITSYLQFSVITLYQWQKNEHTKQQIIQKNIQFFFIERANTFGYMFSALSKHKSNQHKAKEQYTSNNPGNILLAE